MPENEEEVAEDPFLLLGYGVNSYFDIKNWLMRFFLMLTIFALPLYIFYAGNDQQGMSLESLYFFKQFTIGNLAGASVACRSKRIGAGSVSVSCPAGTIIDYDNLIYGVMSQSLSQSNYCSEEGIWEKEDKDKHSKCSDFLDKPYVTRQLETCKASKEKGECKISIKNSLTGSAPSDCGKDARFYM